MNGEANKEQIDKIDKCPTRRWVQCLAMRAGFARLPVRPELRSPTLTGGGSGSSSGSRDAARLPNRFGRRGVSMVAVGAEAFHVLETDALCFRARRHPPTAPSRRSDHVTRAMGGSWMCGGSERACLKIAAHVVRAPHSLRGVGASLRSVCWALPCRIMQH